MTRLRRTLDRLRTLPFGSALRGTVQRFPLPLLASLALTAVLLVLKHRPDLTPGVPLDKAAVGAGLSFLWLLAARLLAEGRGWTGLRDALPALAGVAVIAARLAVDPVVEVESVFLAGGLALLILAAPALGRDAGSARVWTAGYRLGAAIMLAGVAAALLAGGVCLVLVALKHLLGIPVPDALYSDVALVCATLLLPALALAGLPVVAAAGTMEAEAPPRAVTVVGTWILTPVALAYLVTLLAYTVKIAVQGELPRGEVTWIASLFSAAGVSAWLVVWPLRSSGPAHVRLFHRILFPALAIPAALLILAVSIRIRAYGVTEERYLAALFGGWAAVVSVVYTLARHRLSIAWAPGLLGLALCFASIGPWGERTVSVTSQTDRLVALLTAEGRLRDGRIVAGGAPVDARTVREIRSRLHYLIGRKAGDRITAWLPEGRGWRLTHADVEGVLAAMGIQAAAPDPQTRRLQIVTPFAARAIPGDAARLPSVDAAGYDFVVSLVFSGREAVTVRSVDPGYRIELRRTDGVLSVSADGGGGAGGRVDFDLDRLARQVAADAGMTAGVLRPGADKAGAFRIAADGDGGLRALFVVQELDVTPLLTTGAVRGVQGLLLLGGAR